MPSSQYKIPKMPSSSKLIILEKFNIIIIAIHQQIFFLKED